MSGLTGVHNQVRIKATPDIIEKIREFVSCENPIKNTSWFNLDDSDKACYADYYEFVEKRHNAEPIVLSLNSIMPQPENIFDGLEEDIEQPQLEDKPGSYDLDVKNWSTISDAVEIELNVIDDTEIIYNFKCTWLPPISVFEHLGDLFPDASITHTFVEFDMNYAGIREYTGSELIRCEDDDILVINDEDGFEVVGPDYVLNMF